MKRIATLMILLIALALPAAAQEYADGIYRGFYYDGGIEQIAIQFELKDGKFDSLVYRGVKYKDGDYMSEDASDAQKAILRQYRQLADYLVGKGVSAIDDLYSPYDIVEDLDAVTTATMKAGKAGFRPLGRAEPPPLQDRRYDEAARGRALCGRRLSRQLHGGRRRAGRAGIHPAG